MKKIKYSILEVGIIPNNYSFDRSIKRIVKGAKEMDKLGFERIWIAEHHNNDMFVCSATSIIISHVAAKTRNIRVGSGGIMLLNHPPLIIAEQFGTLASIFPSRIDLGVGSGAGADQKTMRLLRRNNLISNDKFPDNLKELSNYFNVENNSYTHAIPGRGTSIPVWILGSSSDSAKLAGKLGLPYVYAGHLKYTGAKEASDTYKREFIESTQLNKPYFAISMNAIAAESNREAAYLSTSMLNMMGGAFANRKVPFFGPTKKLIYDGVVEIEKKMQPIIKNSLIGNKNTIAKKLVKLFREIDCQEVFLTNYIYNNKKRLKALEILANSFEIANNRI